MSSALCVNKTLDLLDADIAVICEHKLSPTNFKFLETLHPDYTAFPPQNQDAYTGNEKSHVSILVKKIATILCFIFDLVRIRSNNWTKNKYKQYDPGVYFRGLFAI